MLLSGTNGVNYSPGKGNGAGTCSGSANCLELGDVLAYTGTCPLTPASAALVCAQMQTFGLVVTDTGSETNIRMGLDTNGHDDWPAAFWSWAKSISVSTPPISALSERGSFLSFDPVGAFDVRAPAASRCTPRRCKVYHGVIPRIFRGLLRRIYYHWEGRGIHGCVDGAYNGVVDFENGAWVLKLSTDFRDNMAGLNSNAAASHTWERNTNALGIAIAGMDGATTTGLRTRWRSASRVGVSLRIRRCHMQKVRSRYAWQSPVAWRNAPVEQ